MGLEDFLYGSKNVRDYLKLFSEQQWNRLCKATMMLGIQYLANLTGNNLRTLSVKDIEDIVGTYSQIKWWSLQFYSGHVSLASDGRDAARWSGCLTNCVEEEKEGKEEEEEDRKGEKAARTAST